MTATILHDIFSSRRMRPFIIAEMSGNHNQSLDRAFMLVEAAAKAGANSIKLQTYTADTMTLDIESDEFLIDNPDSLWKGNSLYALYEKAHTPWEWHEPIFNRARELGLIAFSSPFDRTSVDFLESLDVPCYKIASFENTDIPLIKKVASTGKPMFMSTGMATYSELEESVQAARDSGCKELMLLKCTSEYPALTENMNLLTLPDMRDSFGCEIGLSDHTIGCVAAITSVALGVKVIEKHFTLDRNDGGVDSSFSLIPEELALLVNETEHAWKSLGKVSYGPTKAEKVAVTRRRSIYVTEDMKSGDVFTEQNLRCIRPGNGLPPKHFDSLLGKAVNCDVKKGTPVRWDLVS